MELPINLNHTRRINKDMKKYRKRYRYRCTCDIESEFQIIFKDGTEKIVKVNIFKNSLWDFVKEIHDGKEKYISLRSLFDEKVVIPSSIFFTYFNLSTIIK